MLCVVCCYCCCLFVCFRCVLHNVFPTDLLPYVDSRVLALKGVQTTQQQSTKQQQQQQRSNQRSRTHKHNRYATRTPVTNIETNITPTTTTTTATTNDDTHRPTSSSSIRSSTTTQTTSTQRRVDPSEVLSELLDTLDNGYMYVFMCGSCVRVHVCIICAL